MNHFRTGALSRTISSPITAKGFWRDYLSVPYRAGGRSLQGWDCYGCVRHILVNHAGIDLPMFEEATALEYHRQLRRSIWHRVEGKPQVFDVVTIPQATRIGPLPLHIGVMVAENLMLHAEHGCGTVCLPLNNPTIKYRLGPIYRHDSRNLSA